jgi:glutamate synthase domain-containing protein 3
MISNMVAKKYGYAGLPDDTISVTFDGCAGQSFGAFLSHGITFKLFGEANDYVGKGLSGGKIIIRPGKKAKFKSEDNTAAGNVLLYGATGGKLLVNGQVGERFAIRNSGASAVVEGAGDHCCEYMTGGRIVILGGTGVNFGAGMSGGLAYVYDEYGDFDLKCNLSMVDLESVEQQDDIELTGSAKSGAILADWETALQKFVKVFPVEYRKVLGRMMKEDEEAVDRKLESA